MIDSFFEDRALSCQSVLRMKSRRLINPGWSYVEIDKLILNTLQNLHNVDVNYAYFHPNLVYSIQNMFSMNIDGDDVVNLLNSLYKEMEIV